MLLGALFGIGNMIIAGTQTNIYAFMSWIVALLLFVGNYIGEVEKEKSKNSSSF